MSVSNESPLQKRDCECSRRVCGEYRRLERGYGTHKVSIEAPMKVDLRTQEVGARREGGAHVEREGFLSLVWRK